MTLLVAVDVGYGFTKTVTETTMASFPSTVAVPRMGGDVTARGDGETSKYRMSLSERGEAPREWLVGEAALLAGAERTWETEASQRFGYRELIYAGCSAVEAEGDVDLAVGLPLAVWRRREERQALQARLANMAGNVSLNRGFQRALQVRTVRVFAQGLGCFVAENANAQENKGLFTGNPVGVLDIGYRTTDFVLLVPDGGHGVTPSDEHAGSADVGIGAVYRGVGRRLQRETGRLLSRTIVEDAIRHGRPLLVSGKPVDWSQHMESEAAAAAQLLRTELAQMWDHYWDTLGCLLITGGGGETLWPALRGMHPMAKLATSPVYGNARGFLAILAES